MKNRWPHLMRVYGIMPWQTGDLTDDEWSSILKDQDAEFAAAKAEAARRKRQQPQRRR